MKKVHKGDVVIITSPHCYGELGLVNKLMSFHKPVIPRSKKLWSIILPYFNNGPLTMSDSFSRSEFKVIDHLKEPRDLKHH